MKIVIDESVGYGFVALLKDIGHDVIAIAESTTSGLQDSDIFNVVKKEKSSTYYERSSFYK